MPNEFEIELPTAQFRGADNGHRCRASGRSVSLVAGIRLNYGPDGGRGVLGEVEWYLRKVES